MPSKRAVPNTDQLDLGFFLEETVSNSNIGNVDFSSESNEYYTPNEIVIPSKKVLGGKIDLDPASCEIANSIVMAENIFTIADNGLTRRWNGSFLCNPPGGVKNNRSVAATWWDKALEEWESGYADSGIFIAFNPELGRRRLKIWDFQVCIPFERIAFLKVAPTGVLVVDPSPPKWNLIIHLPSRKRDTVSLFYEEFSKIGRVIQDQNKKHL
jgi:hypothetical protein